MEYNSLPTEIKAKVTNVHAIAEKDRDEAKIHPDYLDLKESQIVCGALAKSGKPCVRDPFKKEDGSTNGRCELHGGKSTGAKSEEGRKRSLANLKKKSPVHGLYTERLWNELTNEEKDFLAWFEDSIREYYHVETAVEETSLQMMAMEAVKHFRMINTQPFKETKTGMQMVQKFLRFIEVQGWRKKDISTEHKKGVDVNTMMNLLNDLDESNENKDDSGKIKRVK